jgi:hypothetical protein
MGLIDCYKKLINLEGITIGDTYLHVNKPSPSTSLEKYIKSLFSIYYYCATEKICDNLNLNQSNSGKLREYLIDDMLKKSSDLLVKEKTYNSAKITESIFVIEYIENKTPIRLYITKDLLRKKDSKLNKNLHLSQFELKILKPFLELK